MELKKQKTAREVLIDCRSEIPSLRQEVNRLQRENRTLKERLDTFVSLYQRTLPQGGMMHSPDPLMNDIQEQIKILHEEK